MYVKKCPSRIRCWDSNSHSSQHVSPPITTRQGLPPLTTKRWSEDGQKNENQCEENFQKIFYKFKVTPPTTTQFCPLHPTDVSLQKRFFTIGCCLLLSCTNNFDAKTTTMRLAATANLTILEIETTQQQQ